MADQRSLFDGSEAIVEERFDAPGLDVVVHRAAFAAPEADALLAAVQAEVPWRADVLVIHGRPVPLPRLQAWQADPGLSYTYSGLRLEPTPWTEAVTTIRRVVEELAGTRFNSVLVNLYRTGADSVGWHADDEPELGNEPVIGSVSLGATRRFQLRRQDDPSVRHTIELRHGDVVVMAGTTQALWHHQLAKTSARVGPRVNLTFRRIVDVC